MVLAAVSQNGYALLHASHELRADREVVSTAVGQNGLALWYTSTELRASCDVRRLTEVPGWISRPAVVAALAGGYTPAEALELVLYNQRQQLLLCELSGAQHLVTGWLGSNDWDALARAQHPDLAEDKQPFHLADLDTSDRVGPAQLGSLKPALLAGEGPLAVILVWTL